MGDSDMPKKTEWHWDALGVSRAYEKTWDDLGITPAQFRLLREASHRHFTTGKKSESGRIWSLLKAGHTVKSLIALANVDVRESSVVLGCLLELTDRRLPNSREALKGVRSFLEYLPYCDSVETVNWMQSMSLDCLALLKDAGLIDMGDALEHRTLLAALEQIREGANRLPQNLEATYLVAMSARFEHSEIFEMVDAGRFGWLISQYESMLQAEAEIAAEQQESEEFASGQYGDWKSLGVSIEQMHEIVDGYYRQAVSTGEKLTSFYEGGANNALFTDFRNLVKGGWSVTELLERIRCGLTADDVRELQIAGLQVTQANLDEWSEVESAVILFLIDNGFTRDDRCDGLFEDWMPSASLVFPWWEFCKKNAWVNQFTRRQLLYGHDPEDARPDQIIETRFDYTITKLLSLEECLNWGPLKERLDEIQKWRLAGFTSELHDRTPDYSGSDGDNYRDALAWCHFKFSPTQAAAWVETHTGPREASMWRSGKIKPDEVQAWRSVGIRHPAEAARWVASGASPQVADVRKKAGITPPNLS